MTDDDPIDCDDGRFVLARCIYAGAVLNGELPGPSRESAARAFARVSLIPVEMLGLRLTEQEWADMCAALGVPEREVRLARRGRCGCRRRLIRSDARRRYRRGRQRGPS